MAFVSTFVRAVIGLAALGALYELYAASLQNPVFFPPLSAIGRKAIELSTNPDFQRHVRTSASILVQGLLPAAVIGIVVGLIIGTNAVLRWVFGPLVSALAGVPVVVLAPPTIMWLGGGTQSRIMLVALFAVLPIVRTVMAGVAAGRRRGNPPAESSDATTAAEREVRTATAIVSGLRWGLLLGVTGVVVGEMIGADAGIGYIILQSMQRLDMANTLAGVLTLAVPVVLAVVLLDAIEAQLAAARTPRSPTDDPQSA